MKFVTDRPFADPLAILRLAGREMHCPGPAPRSPSGGPFIMRHVAGSPRKNPSARGATDGLKVDEKLAVSLPPARLYYLRPRIGSVYKWILSGRNLA
jgi:hypothetical protein